MGQASVKPAIATDFPIWDDCPFKAGLPEGVEARIDQGHPGGPVCWLLDVKSGMHVAYYIKALPDDKWWIAVRNLRGAQFHKKYPAGYSASLKADTGLKVRGTPIPAGLAAMYKEWKEMLEAPMPQLEGSALPSPGPT